MIPVSLHAAVFEDLAFLIVQEGGLETFYPGRPVSFYENHPDNTLEHLFSLGDMATGSYASLRLSRLGGVSAIYSHDGITTQQWDGVTPRKLPYTFHRRYWAYLTFVWSAAAGLRPGQEMVLGENPVSLGTLLCEVKAPK